MDERPSTTSTSYDQSTIEEHAQESPSDTHLEEQLSAGFDQEDSGARTPASPHESTSYGFTRDEEEIDPANSAWVEDDQSSSGSPKESEDPKTQVQDKGKEREMSYPGDYYHSGTTSSPQGRRPEISRTSPSSSASTPRQGSEEAKGDDKREDRSGSGSGSGSGGGNASASGSSRSRLVAGVFVRY